MKRVPPTLEEALAKAEYFVEADSFALQALWTMYVQRPDPTFPIKVEWESPSGGRGYKIQLEKGTHLECRFDYVFGKLVCFYCASSARIDWLEIEAFLEQFISKTASCKAHNFSRCIVGLRNKK